MELLDEQDSSPPSATLGEVLYANNTKPLVLEAEWVRLVRSIADGNQLALHALYERAHRVVYTLIMRIVGSPSAAEELTVDVFHDVWKRAQAYDPGNGTVLGWVMNQARSRALDKLRFDRRLKRVAPADDEGPEDLHDGPLEALVGTAHDRQVLEQALTELTPDEREAIELAYFSELSYVEVAQRLDTPHGTIKTRIRSGLNKLRSILSAEAGGL